MVSIGLVGVGAWGKNHAKTLRQLLDEGAIDSLIFCDISEKMAREAAGADGEWVTDHRKLFGKVDAVSIATSTSTHYTLAKDFLEHGIDAMVEKPISETTEQALELDSLAAKNGRVLMVGHVFVYNPVTQYIKKLIDSGRLGDVFYAFGSFSGLKNLRADSGTTHTYIVHHVAVANYLFGEPTKVAGFATPFLRSEFEDITLVVLKYGKVTAYFDASWLPPGKARSLTVVGSKATVVSDLLSQKTEIHHNSFDGNRAVQGDVEIPTKEDMPPADEPLKDELRHFLRCVGTRERPMTDGKSAVAVMRVVDKIMASKWF